MNSLKTLHSLVTLLHPNTLVVLKCKKNPQDIEEDKKPSSILYNLEPPLIPGVMNKGLNMFLVPIKLRPSKFSPYLILIAFFNPLKKFLHSILVLTQSKFV